VTAATLTSKGQLTLPKEIRDALGVGPGDRVYFVRMEDGNFAVVPATAPVARLKGLLKKRAKSVSLDAMEKAIIKGASGA
jgi:AbrB family looped-hinge helix DNA binding protein